MDDKKPVRLVTMKGFRLTPMKLSNKKHTPARKKAGMHLNNWYNRTDLCNLATTRKSRDITLSITK